MKSILNYTFVFYLILSGNIFFSQEKKMMTNLNSIDLGFGQKIMQANFYKQLSHFDNVALFKPVSYIGFGGYNHFIVTNKHHTSSHFFYQQVIPQNIAISDSIQGKISGFNLAATVFGKDLLGKSKSFDFLVGVGFNTGRLRVYKNDLIRQKNPYFSPKISITPRAKIGKFILSFNVDYEFDISKPGWRGTAFSKDNMINISNLRQSGFNGFLSIGKFIGDKSDKKK